MEENNNRWKEEVAEDCCFICKDGGLMRICDYGDCLKACHPECERQEDSFLERDDYWCCGSHYCCVCRKSSYFQCYCCPKAFCKNCIEENDDFSVVKGKKGFCSHCLELARLIEEKSDVTSDGVKIDFTAPDTYECLYSEYYRQIKDKEGFNYSHVHSAHILGKKATEANQAAEVGPSVPQKNKAKAPPSTGSEVATPTTALQKRKSSASTSCSLGPRRHSSHRLHTSSSVAIPTSSENVDLSVDVVHAGASVDNVCDNVSESVTNPLVASTYPLVPANFASWTSRDDAKLASSFLFAHPDIVFPDSSYAQCFLEKAYKTFVFVLKMFRDSSSTHELVSQNRALLVDQLKGMKHFGFSGSWLENLLDKLDGPNSLHAPEDLSLLDQTEGSYVSQRETLMVRINDLTSNLKATKYQLIEVETKLKNIAAEKKCFEEACDELDFFVHF